MPKKIAATEPPPELDILVDLSRRLGSDPLLAYAGGGNTSAKATTFDLYGQPLETIFVKGSGSDLATATRAAMTPLPLAETRRLLDLPALSDRAMMKELGRLRLDPEAPLPSVEALLHAFLPARYVLHAHPVALLALLDSERGGELARELYAHDCLIVPYVKPGFDLALAVWRAFERANAARSAFRGMVLEKHGLFAFADDPEECYSMLLELVARAEKRLPRRPRAARRAMRAQVWAPLELARLRQAISRSAGRPMTLRRVADRATLAYLDRSDLARVAQRGTLTPDHVIRTKRRPLLVRRAREIDAAVQRFVADYQKEFGRFDAGRGLVPLDPAPRVVLIPGTGLFGVGATPKEAEIAATTGAQTAWAIERAEALGGWRPLAPRELFEVEYWELEQAKLARAGKPRALAGRVAIVTGSASGIGRASARALLDQGAAVVGLDLAPSELAGDFVAVVGDATRRADVRRALEPARQ